MMQTLTSLDRAFSCQAEVIRPDRYRQLLSLGEDEIMAVQGGATAYAATSFGGGARVVNISRFNRLLGFDLKTRILEAEAGITLDKLFRFLTPLGYMVPVMPGHPYISLGGCIASNVHGKNQFQDGIFSEIVEEVRLFHPAHGIMVLNKNSDPEIFELTCGGHGLTGIIISAKIRVAKLSGNCVEVTHIPAKNLEDTFRLLNRYKDTIDVVHSWNDLSRFDSAMGRGYIVAGKFITRDIPAKAPRLVKPIDPFHRSSLYFPLINRLTLPLLNGAYFRTTRNERPRTKDLFSTLFPAWNKPLYFNAYGRRGFLEPQVLVPNENSLDYLAEFESLLRRHRQPFGVASFKIFRGQQKLLHYNGSGISYSLHIANTQGARKMLSEMDAINLRHGVITNLIKDSRLSAETARAQYPQFEDFANRLKAFDPKRVWKTALSDRLGL